MDLDDTLAKLVQQGADLGRVLNAVQEQMGKMQMSVDRLENRVTNIEVRLDSTNRRIETMGSFPYVATQPVAEWCASRHSVSGSDWEPVRYLR